MSERDALDASPGRGAFVSAIQHRVLGAAVLIGTYLRVEPMETDARSAVSAEGFGAVAT